MNDRTKIKRVTHLPHESQRLHCSESGSTWLPEQCTHPGISHTIKLAQMWKCFSKTLFVILHTLFPWSRYTEDGRITERLVTVHISNCGEFCNVFLWILSVFIRSRNVPNKLRIFQWNIHFTIVFTKIYIPGTPFIRIKIFCFSPTFEMTSNVI